VQVIDEALLRIVSAHAGEKQTFADPPAPMTGGFWARIYGFELDDPPADLAGRLVLRVMPNGAAAARETIVQRAVAEQGYPTPRVVLDGVDPELGGSFMVMERAAGVAQLDGLGIGRALLQLPQTIRGVARQLSVASAQLHELDPQPIRERFEDAGIDNASLGVAARLDEIRAAAEARFAGFEELLAWLDDQRPLLTPEVICHGDIHPFNMLVTEDGSFSMLDWTNANLCRREYDVGLTAALLRCAPLPVPRLARRSVGAVAGSLARRFIDAYRRMAPINLDVVEWFETLQYGRCLAAVATAALVNDGIVGPGHPFRVSAPAMIRQVGVITGATIVLPDV
jgi:aminoglycoside phosphotransferase (APT) family kinase protein